MAQPGQLECVICRGMSGGGTHTPAAVVIHGISVCDRHMDDARELAEQAQQPPEVSPQ